MSIRLTLAEYHEALRAEVKRRAVADAEIAKLLGLIVGQCTQVAAHAEAREREFAALLDQLQDALAENMAWSRAGRDTPAITPEQTAEIAATVAPKRAQQRGWLQYFRGWFSE